MARHVLLAENASNGTGSSVAWDGGSLTLYGDGTWGGATATLQYAPYGPSGQSLTPVTTGKSITSAAPITTFDDLPSGNIRIVIAGGGGTESLTIVASRTK